MSLEPTTGTTGMDRAVVIARPVLRAAVLTSLWTVQYVVVLPMVLCLATFGFLVKAAAKVGVVGFVLLFVPIIGWIILAIVFSGRRQRDRQHSQHMAALASMGATIPSAGRPLLQRCVRPWGLSVLR